MLAMRHPFSNEAALQANKLKKRAMLMLGAELPPDQVEGLRMLFDQMDRDKSQTITFEELRLAVRQMGSFAADHEVLQMLDATDIDKGKPRRGFALSAIACPPCERSSGGGSWGRVGAWQAPAFMCGRGCCCPALLPSLLHAARARPAMRPTPTSVPFLSARRQDLLPRVLCCHDAHQRRDPAGQPQGRLPETRPVRAPGVCRISWSAALVFLWSLWPPPFPHTLERKRSHAARPSLRSNKDGMLDPNEVLTCLQQVDHTASMADARQAIRDCDADGNGRVRRGASEQDDPRLPRSSALPSQCNLLRHLQVDLEEFISLLTQKHGSSSTKEIDPILGMCPLGNCRRGTCVRTAAAIGSRSAATLYRLEVVQQPQGRGSGRHSCLLIIPCFRALPRCTAARPPSTKTVYFAPIISSLILLFGVCGIPQTTFLLLERNRRSLVAPPLVKLLVPSVPLLPPALTWAARDYPPVRRLFTGSMDLACIDRRSLEPSPLPQSAAALIPGGCCMCQFKVDVSTRGARHCTRHYSRRRYGQEILRMDEDGILEDSIIDDI